MGTTRMKVRKEGKTYGHVGTLLRVAGETVTLELEVLREGRVEETFHRKEVEVVRALRN